MNPITCISDSGYFASPEFLKLALHTSSIISTPIYCLGVYCILFKTPDQMSSVKWYMFTLLISIILFDYTIAVLSIPLIMFPIPAGISYGVLHNLGVPMAIESIFVIVVFGYMAIAIVSIYENRFFILCQFRFKQKWVIFRRIWLIAHYVHFAAIYIGVYPQIPEQVEARKWLFRISPCLPEYLYQEPLFVLAYDYSYLMTVSVSSTVIFIVEIAFFIFSLVWNAVKQLKSKSMSLKTYQMHKQFFIALLIQITVPFSLLVFPLAYAEVTVIVDYHNQGHINVGVVIIACHGLVTTIVMILVHKPYRLAVKELIRRNVTRATPKVSMECWRKRSTVVVPN